jgi:transcriptional regulator with XRE-family HTH domain
VVLNPHGVHFAIMCSAHLTNYLKTNRKRLALKQEEVAFLLGFKGEDKGIKVCRDETFAREPSLQMALAYEAIYERPVRELFAGLYEQVEQEVAERAKILTYRKDQKPNPKRLEALTNLVSKAIA